MVTPRHYDTILKPIITEKATLLSENGKVVFQVPLSATKPEIVEAIEGLFKVKVAKVNTLVKKGKTRRFRNKISHRTDVKKAIVTLQEGHSIDVTTGL